MAGLKRIVPFAKENAKKVFLKGKLLFEMQFYLAYNNGVMSSYMIVLLCAGAIPFLFSFFPPLHFYRHWRALLQSIGCILVLFGSWDVLATFRGHWWFNPQGVWPLRIINLPLEEVLFFIVIPFCCIFTWEAIGYVMKNYRRAS